MNSIVKYLIVFILAGHCSLIFAFEKVIPVRSFSVNNGLSQSTVTAFLRDKDDLIWIGTSDGLNCFDGSSNKVFKHSLYNKNSIVGNTIRQIFETETGNLWINTETGISYFDKKSNNFINFEKLRSIYAIILKQTDEKIWLWIHGKGFHLFNTSNQNLIEFPNQSSESEFTKWLSLYEVKIIKNKSYLSYSHLLEFNFEEGKENFKVVEKLKDNESGIFYFDDYFVLINNKKIIFKSTSNKVIKIIDFKYNVRLIKQVEKDVIWIIAENNKVFEYHLKTNKFISLNFKPFDGNVENYLITNVFIDKDKNYWITTDGKGILVSNPSKLKFEHFKISKLDHSIRFISEDSLGRLWISVHLDGIYIVNKSFEVLEQLSFNHPVCKSNSINSVYNLIFIHQKAYVTTNNGLLELSLKNINTIKFYPQNPSITLKTIDLTALDDKNILVSSNIGLLKFNLISKSYENLNFLKKINFFKHWKNEILLGTSQGLYVYQNGNISKISLDKNDEINNINIKSIHISNNEKVFLCTEVGLVEMDKNFKNLQLLTTENGLPDNFIYSILESNNNQFYGSTNKGLFYYNIDKKIIKSFNLNDGLQSLEFNSKSFLKDSDDNFYFGGIYGLNRFKPVNTQSDTLQPAIHLSKIKIFEDEFSWTYLEKITFNHLQNTLSFEVKTKEFIFPENIRYAFKLNGLEEDFVETGSRNLIRYPNLSAGNYQLFAKAANKDGIWCKEKLLIEFKIEPPFYKKTGFILLLILILLVILYFAIKTYTNRKIKKKLEEIERQKMIYMERLRISRDMHDDIGAGISKIAIMSEVAKNHSDKQEILNKISLSSRELVDNISHIIWSLNPDNDKFDNLLSYIRQFTNEYFENTGIICLINFDILEKNISLSQEERRNIFLVIKESFNNILKYSEATKVEFSIQSKNKLIIIDIIDNGKGFDLENSLLKGNGLSNMAKRIDEIGGNFKITTAVNKGTKINIVIKNNMFEVFL